jgi:hypothetical protein
MLDIRKGIENNPIIYMIATAVAVAGVAVGVVEFLCRERIEIIRETNDFTVKTLQAELASIRRGLGENQSLDVRTFVYPKGSAPIHPISPKAQYVSGDDFYANLNLPDWRYEVMDGEQFTRAAFGDTSFDDAIPAVQKTLKASRLHVWSPIAGVTRIELKHSDGTVADRAGPFILLSKSSIAEMLGIVGKYLPELRDPNTGETITSEKVKEIKDNGIPELDELFRGDAAGLFLGDLARQHFSALVGASSDFKTQLAEVQKVGNVLYVQFLTTLLNAEVDGKRLPKLFVREEIILITDQVNVTTIEVIVPSADPSPRGPVYAQIQEWFSTLAIPVS